MNIKESLKKFWNFLKADTWQSWIVSLILLIVFVKFIFFPIMSLLTGTPLPLVIVESCSMYHSSDFENFWAQQGAWYEAHGITKEQFQQFPFKNGLNKGDILFVLGRTNISKGDVIIFNAGSAHPLIHRIVAENPESLATKGDHNSDQLKPENNLYKLDETKIDPNNIVGEAKLKVLPLLGWVKLIFFEPFRSPSERGFCK